MEKLHSGAKWVFRFRAYLSLLFILIFLGSFMLPIMITSSIVSDSPSSLFFYPIPLLFVMILISEVYSRLAYKNWKFEFGTTELKLERGIIWKKYSSIPYERIQNVDVNRGILARIIGFSTLDVQTAGYHYVGRGGAVSEGHIPAVSIKKAEEIREFLIKKIGKRQGL